MSLEYQSSNVGQLVNLDILRAIAVLLVVGAHFAILVLDNPVFFKIFEPGLLGTLGVVLFFVHTSLVLMMSLDRMSKASNESHGLVKKFFIQRIFRIYPLSVFVVLLYYFGEYPGGDAGVVVSLDFVQFLANIILVQNFLKNAEILAPLWSLSYEIQMYLMLPFIWLAIRNLRSPIVVIAVWIGLLFFATTLADKVEGVSENLSYFSIPAFLKWMPSFVPGIFAYLIIRSGPKQIIPHWILWCVMLTLASGYMITYNIEKTMLAAGMIGILLPYVSQCKNKIIISISRAIAKYSYGIYLFHILGITQGYMSGLFDNEAVKFLVFFVITFGLSFTTFHLLERPMISLGKHLSSRFD